MSKGRKLVSLTSLMLLRLYLRYYCPWMNPCLGICTPRKCDFHYGLGVTFAYSKGLSLSRQRGHVSLQEGSRTSNLSSNGWSSSQWRARALEMQ